MGPARAQQGTRPAGSRSRGGPWRAGAFYLPAFIATSILFMESVLRVRADAPFLNSGLLYAALFAAVAALLITVVASVLNGVVRTVFVGVCLGAITVLFMSQLLYFDVFGTFYTVFSASRGGQVAEFQDVILLTIRENLAWLAVLSLPLVLFAALSRRVPASRHRFTWVQRGVAVGVAGVLFASALSGINLGDRGHASAYDMYYRNNEPVASVNQLGLVTSMRLDVQHTLLGFTPEGTPPPPPPPPADTSQQPDREPAGTGAADDGATPSEGTASPSDEPGVPTEEPVAVEPHVLDIDFDALRADTTDEDLRNAHLYFGTREPTTSNAHTGRFEGYNLIFITAEAYSHYAVDEEVTPTLHKMTHEGFNFTNFYNPVWGVSTSDGEYVATTGLIPKSGVWSMLKSGANSMPFAMGNQLSALGYTTHAYHNHTYDYYGRDVSHPNLGYDYKGVGNGLDVAQTWPESDLEMIDVTTEEFVHDEPFHAYYMTVSGHLLYNFSGNAMALKNRDLVQDLPYTEAGRAYLATQIELDRALELLMERLEEAGVADNTLIVLSADHYPYGLEKGDIDDLAGHEVESHFDLHKSSLIVYAKGMEPEVIDEPVSSLDIIPTLSNLMGLEFDSRLLMGRDVFSEADPLVIFQDRSFITDQGRYNATARDFIPADGVQVSEDYRQLISDEIDRRFYYSALVLDRDYYDIVLP